MAATSVTDPVSFTADATKLVIRSVKATYDALSSVRHGSNRVESMLVSLTQLQRIVEGFRQRGIAGANVAEQLRVCERDLAEIQTRLTRLNTRETDGGLARATKQAKRTLKEDELEKMTGLISGHVQILALLLQEESQSIVSANHEALVTTAASTETRTREIHERQDITNSSITTFKDDTATRFQGVENLLTESRAASSAQNALIIQLFEQIRDQVDRMTTTVTTNQNGAEATAQNDTECRESASIGARCDTIIEQLCHIVRDAEYEAKSDEAKEIIDCLQNLITGFCTLPMDQNTETSPDNRDGIKDSMNAERVKARFKKIEFVLSEMRSILVNKQFEPDPNDDRRIIRSRRTDGTVDLAEAGVAVWTLRRTRQQSGVSQISESGSESQREDTIVWRPKSRRKKTQIRLSILRRVYSNAQLSFSSRITVNNICPSNKPVFRALAEGDVSEFFRIIREDKNTSIRDCDEYGASLLFYAFGYPKAFKFLLKSGLDVDTTIDRTGDPSVSYFMRMSYHGPWKAYYSRETAISSMFVGMHDIFPCYVEKSLPARVLECYRMFVDAGGDPTIRYHGETLIMSKSISDVILQEGTLEMMKSILQSPFVNLESKVMSGKTLLLQAFDCKYPSFGTIALLLDRGANVNAEDDDGHSCLHILLARERLLADQWQFISLLLRNGFNAFAVNNYESSVLEHIVEYNTRLEQRYAVISAVSESPVQPVDGQYFFEPLQPDNTIKRILNTCICPHLLGFRQSSADSGSPWTCHCSAISTLWPDLDDLDRDYIKHCCKLNDFERSEFYRAKVTEVITEEWARGPESLFSGSQRADLLIASATPGPNLDDLIEREKVIKTHALLLEKEVETALRNALISVRQIAHLKERLIDAFLAYEQVLELFAKKERKLQFELRRQQVLRCRARKAKLIGITIGEGDKAGSLCAMLSLARFLRFNQCQG